MLNYLWAGMIFIGIIYAAFTGQMPDITDAAINTSIFAPVGDYVDGDELKGRNIEN